MIIAKGVTALSWYTPTRNVVKKPNLNYCKKMFSELLRKLVAHILALALFNASFLLLSWRVRKYLFPRIFAALPMRSYMTSLATQIILGMTVEFWWHWVTILPGAKDLEPRESISLGVFLLNSYTIQAAIVSIEQGFNEPPRIFKALENLCDRGE